MRTLVSFVAWLCLWSIAGCASDNEHAFSGSITRAGHEPIRGTLPMGGSFSNASTDRRLAIFGLPVGLVGYTVALVYELEGSGRLTTDAIREVYRVNRAWYDGRFDFQELLDLSPQQRASLSDLTPLRGSVRIERWSNNLSHRIHLDLATEDGSSSIRGTVWSRERLDPNPLRFFGMLFWMTGAYEAVEGRTVASSQEAWSPMADWQSYDARGERAERGVAVLVDPQTVLAPTSLAMRWAKDDKRAALCTFTPAAEFLGEVQGPFVTGVEPLPGGALCRVRLDQAVQRVEPALVDESPAKGEVVVIVRDSLERIARGTATLRGVTNERIRLPRLDDEARPVGGVALHATTGRLVALLDGHGRVLPVNR